MRKKLLFLSVFLVAAHFVKSQSCIPTNINNTVVNLACGQACTTFTYQVPDLKNTNSYLLTSIPYTPLPYVVATGGSEDPNLYDDDKYSTLVNIPFTFCFYGANYNSLVVGSNGLITFDATNAACANAYTISPTIPNSGGTQCSQFSTYYPKAAIMAAYADLDPRPGPGSSTQASPPDRKIQWRVEGTAPCRKFVISFYHIGIFGDTAPSGCGYVTPSTFQIIIYESTGIIDIFFQNKSCVSSTNSGRSILGIQDFTRLQALAAPGKNATVWNASNEGYRFTPNSGASNFVSAQMFNLGGGFIANGNISTPTPGLIDITYPNICPPAVPSTQYVFRTTFNSCTASPLISSDTVTFNRTITLPVDTSTVPTTCGASIGSITITPTAGTIPYTYTINGTGAVTVPGAHTFTGLAAGSYTIHVVDFNGCDTTFLAIVNTNTLITATVSSTSPSCAASTNGTITVTPTSGTAPYMYSLDGGPPQASNIFTNVPAGPHTVTFTDAMSCAGSVSVNLAPGTTVLTATFTSTPTTCPLSADGTITITPTSGTAPHMFSLDGGPPQAGNVFTNLTPGPHTIAITDAVAGCAGLINFNITAGNTAINATVNVTPTTCPTLNDGTITINPTSGSPAYMYSLDGGLPQASNIFLNVAAGPHSVLVTDMFGCTGTFPVNIAMGSSLTSSINGGNPNCANINDGTIVVNPTSGTAPYMYSLNGGTPQASNTFTGLAPGSYTVDFTDFNGCTGTNSITLTTNPAVTATSVLTNPLCNGNNNGSIVLNAAGGVAPYQYSIDAGATYQVSSTFNGLTVGTYNFLIKDALGCIYGFSYSLVEPSTLSLLALTNFATCPNNDGSINITAGGGTPAYEYSIDNGITYQASNIFPNLPFGNYNTIRVKDANGCISNTTAVVVLNDTMYLDLGADSTICFGSSLTLIPNTNALTDTFNWTPAATLNFNNIRTPVATPNDTTTYTLNAKWGVCQRTDAIRVNVLHKPVPYAGKDTTICYKTNALLNGSATNLSGGINYAWSPPDSLNTPNAATTIARMDTTRKFYLTVTDNYGCNFLVVDSMMVFMQPELVVFAGNDTNAILNRPHQMMASGGTNYVWSPSAPLNNPFIATPLATLKYDTYFTVLVTDAIGCTASDQVFIKVYEGPMYYLPNAFTPNGDGLNDIFRPTPVGIRSTEYFRVFNRFGQRMFETSEWMKGWDGTVKDKPAEAGTYVWMIKGIDKNGSNIEMKGTVILIR
ncbi:MAG: gliding motility-associated C-terminal domain-containing protein [Chitinophagaceae bacterium]|nr:gliding motility-associated C-terminal domain-containing protein [Chitinophagaceae bacterium]